MARYLLQCEIDPAKLGVLAAHRAEHYEFLIAHRNDIVFGGPARADDGGPPETMVMVIEAASAPEAAAFIEGEPYNRNGGFRSITIRVWSQVIPEIATGALQRSLDAERSRGAP